MHGAGEPHEVRARPRVGGEESIWKEIAFQAIAAGAGENDVARVVRAAVGERIDVIQGRGLEIQLDGAVDAAPAAVAHRGALDGAFVPSPAEVFDAGVTRASADAGVAGKPGKHDAVMLSANGHFTSLE
jgi:hypothetical protein